MNVTSNQLSTANRLTPEELAALQNADRFEDFPHRGPPTSNVIQLASREMDVESSKFVPGAAAGLIAMRYGVGDAKAVKDFGFMPIFSEQRFDEYEPARGGELGQFVRSHAQKPPEAQWQADASGKRKCLLPNGNEIKETRLVYMIVDGKRVIVFSAHSSGLRPVNDMLSACKGLSVKRDFELNNGEVQTVRLNGPVISKWKMETLEKREGGYRWWLPHTTLLGKLGDEKGPTFAEVRFAQAAREELLQGGLLSNEASAAQISTATAPATPIAAPVEPPKRLMTVTSGRQVTLEEGPQQPTAPASAYGNDDGGGPIDDDIDF